MKESGSLILLTGANGQVGHEVSRLAGERGVLLAALNRTRLDITDSRAGLSAAKRRVLGLTLVYRPARGQYEHRLSLGTV